MSQKIHSEIALRAVSAIGLIAVTLYALMWWGTFVFLLTALTGGILYEVLKAAHIESALRGSLVGCLTYMQFVSLWPNKQGIDLSWLTALKALMAGFIVALAYVSVRSLIREWKRDSKKFLLVTVSVVYIFAALHALGFLYLEGTTPPEGILYTGGRFRVLGLFLIVWLTDTGAFLVGRALGGPKLAPRLSPGKTWSGFWGGTLLASGFCTLATNLSPHPLFPAIDSATPWFATLALTAILSVAAHAGDLLESFVKRRLGVKDMGTLIPGHGGLADRFDSLLLVSLVAFLTQQLFRFL